MRKKCVIFVGPPCATWFKVQYSILSTYILYCTFYKEFSLLIILINVFLYLTATSLSYSVKVSGWMRRNSKNTGENIYLHIVDGIDVLPVLKTTCRDMGIIECFYN